MLNIIYYRLFLCLKQQFPGNAKPAKNSSVSSACSTKKEHENAFNPALVTIIDPDNSFIFMLKKYFKIIAKSG